MVTKKSKSSLKFTIFIIVASITLVAFSIFLLIVMSHQKKLYMDNLLFHSESISQTILKALEYDMMINSSTTIKRTLESISEEEMIRNISIYNHKGDVKYYAKNKHDTHLPHRLPPERYSESTSRECTVCHSHSEGIKKDSTQNLYYFNTDTKEKCLISLVIPIRNKPSCQTADCHAHPVQDEILGFLNMDVCRKKLQDNLYKSKVELVLISMFFIITIPLLIMIFVKKHVMNPLQQLVTSTEKISQGDLDAKLMIQREDEIGVLSQSFNEMVHKISIFKKYLTSMNEELEQRVENKRKQLQVAQHQIIQAEKMSSLGRLAAVLAHEINNPISGIIVFVKLIEKQLTKNETVNSETKNKILNNLEIMKTEATRCGNLVRDLLSFSRQGAKVENSDIKIILDKAINIMHSKLKNKNIELNISVEENLPAISCIPGQIQQCFMNLLQNSVDAMSKDGDININIFRNTDDNMLVMKFRDSGTGIPENIIPHIFEPFYSSKDKGQSIGIGLFIVYGFIEQHNGTIKVTSATGKGTEFTIKLPYQQELKETV